MNSRVRSKMKQIAKNYYFHFEHALINRFYHVKSKNVFKIKIACANIYNLHTFLQNCKPWHFHMNKHTEKLKV